MIKYVKFHKIATAFYAQYHFKLKVELTLNDFLVFRRKYQENPSLCLKRYSFIKHQGLNFEYPGLVLKNFTIVNKQVEKIDRKVLTEIFDRFDINKDKMVDLKELKAGLEEVLTVESIEELFEKYDEDKDSFLNLREFLSLFNAINLTAKFKC